MSQNKLDREAKKRVRVGDFPSIENIVILMSLIFNYNDESGMVFVRSRYASDGFPLECDINQHLNWQRWVVIGHHLSGCCLETATLPCETVFARRRSVSLVLSINWLEIERKKEVTFQATWLWLATDNELRYWSQHKMLHNSFEWLIDAFDIVWLLVPSFAQEATCNELKKKNNLKAWPLVVMHAIC